MQQTQSNANCRTVMEAAICFIEWHLISAAQQKNNLLNGHIIIFIDT